MKPIAIRVDERVELLAVLAHLSTYDRRLRAFLKADPLPPTNLFYHSVIDHFSDDADAPAVRLFDRLTTNPRFMFDAPVRLFLSLDREETDGCDPELAERCGDRALLDDVRSASLEFLSASRFRAFIRANAASYARLERGVADWLGGGDPIGTLESYLGLSNSTYRVILAPLLIGNYGAYLTGAAGREACAVVTPVNDGGLSFGSGDHVLGIAWHEFLHSFVNDLTAGFLRRAGSASLSGVAVDEAMRSRAYPEAKQVIDESVIRALVVRLFSFTGKAEHAARLSAWEREAGFVRVPALIELLREYEADRASYATIVDFYPRLLSVFE